MRPPNQEGWAEYPHNNHSRTAATALPMVPQRQRNAVHRLHSKSGPISLDIMLDYKGPAEL